MQVILSSNYCFISVSVGALPFKVSHNVHGSIRIDPASFECFPDEKPPGPLRTARELYGGIFRLLIG